MHCHKDDLANRTLFIPFFPPVAGLLSIVAAEAPFTVDRTSPTTGQVYDGANLGLDAQFQDRSDSLCVNWAEFNDPDTGIGRIEWAIGNQHT